MHLVLVTVLALGAQPQLPPPQAMPPQPAVFEGGGNECNCEECCRLRGLNGTRAANAAANRETRHQMPQTCYSSRYGCYFSGERHMNRYPAFHGHYYRKPYNYRNVFDYPWHADMHEPTSLFSYNVPDDPNNAEPLPPGAPNARRAAPQPSNRPAPPRRIPEEDQEPAPVTTRPGQVRPVTAHLSDAPPPVHY